VAENNGPGTLILEITTAMVVLCPRLTTAIMMTSTRKYMKTQIQKLPHLVLSNLEIGATLRLSCMLLITSTKYILSELISSRYYYLKKKLGAFIIGPGQNYV
jgi:hypothetical protein